MAPEKVTVMILDVDLNCSTCYKKVKKLLCKFPQIRDQVFDEENNKVRITVVCCSPEKLRDKLCCKGGRAIQRIEILEDKPKEPEKPKPVDNPKEPGKSKPIEKPKEPEKPKPKEPEKPKAPVKPKELDRKPSGKPPPIVVVPVDKPKADPPKKPEGPEPMPMAPANPHPEPVRMPDFGHGCPQPVYPACPQPVYPAGFPGSTCCSECYEGRSGGPCEYIYGRPMPQPQGPCYDGYQYQYQYGGNRGCSVSRCDYFSEENQQGCSIM